MTDWQPGLIALHGNQTERLADTVLAWLQRHPLPRLEPEVVLVQSNGMAEWFKMHMAQEHGVCAAVSVELPARFVWRTCRQILGPENVPRESPLDKTPMTWRLMRLLPQCQSDPVFTPINHFLQSGEAQRRQQLADRLADLFDQYQVYRGDWLEAWAQGHDELITARAERVPVPADQLWQPALWRMVLQDLKTEEHSITRSALREQAITRLVQGPAPAKPVAKRIVVFGMSQMPYSLMRFLSAMARHSQVLIAVPNPCRYHWADALSGREFLQRTRKRHGDRNKLDLAALPLEAMHLHAHPLLAAWGRQSRDYVRQLDEFDATEVMCQRWNDLSVDVFDETDTHELAQAPLLQQVQQRIRDLVPLHEHPAYPVPASDRSIVFQTAHSLVRELEVLHDHLLALLAEPGQSLTPRDVVVMLPSIDTAVPAIQAVFGQYAQHDPRRIPFAVADVGAKASSPLVVALQWLLRLPQQRCRLSELSDLLEVPAVAARLGLELDVLPELTQWMQGAGIRWGLNHAQRAHLDLGACGDPNSAWFGLQRMLMGFASGGYTPEAAGQGAWAEIEPYDEVGGLSAELAGTLAAFVQRLLQWWQVGRQPATPAQWVAKFRQLLGDFFAPQSEEERLFVAALEQALAQWLKACDQAQFVDAVELPVAQEAWMQALSEPQLEQRFRSASGVTFCTLMPMRAIPFQVVCLLGMNDSDYPRRVSRADFDLMALPRQQRPGDRSRRDDDRQLMLDALLSARRQFYISWQGRSVRDNTEQPPSVLVSQLRDYLAQGWVGEGGQDLPRHAQGALLLAQRTTHHPLQPFSRRYFEAGTGLRTYAREWRSAHASPADAPPPQAPAALAQEATTPPLTIERLAQFLRNPAKDYLRHQLLVQFDSLDPSLPNDECFDLDGLMFYELVGQLQSEGVKYLAQDAEGRGSSLAAYIARSIERRKRTGELPLQGFGQRSAQQLQAQVLPALQAWQEQVVQWPYPAPRERVTLQVESTVLDDWVDELRMAQPLTLAEGVPATTPRSWLQLKASKLLNKDDKKLALRPKHLMGAYLRTLALAVEGVPVSGVLIGRDALVRVATLDAQTAQEQLRTLVSTWTEGQRRPLPLPQATALGLARVLLKHSDDERALAEEFAKKLDAYEHQFQGEAEGEEAEWARCYPTAAALQESGELQTLVRRVYVPFLEWVDQCEITELTETETAQ